MEALLIFEPHQEATLVVEDGGVATFRNNGRHIVVDLYHNRIKEVTDDLWEILGEGKMSCQDYLHTRYLSEEIIKETINWLAPFQEVTVHSVIKRNKHDLQYYIKEFLINKNNFKNGKCN